MKKLNFIRIFSVIVFSAFTIFSSFAQISGTVFRDFNANSTKDANEPGYGGVTVKAIQANGTTQTATSTAGTGAYSFSGLTLPVRVEFSNLGNVLYEGAMGSNNASSVQFYTSATTTANFAINNPAHYSNANANLATPKYLNGNPLASGSNLSNDPSLFRFPNTAAGNAQSGGTPLTTLATQSQIGSTWGVAYSKDLKKLFLAAHYKRHAPLGPEQTGGRVGGRVG